MRPRRSSIVTVDQYDGVRLGEDGDFARRCTVPEPLLNETQSRSHLGLSLQLSNINSIEVLANVVFGISAAERHISTPWAPSVLVNIAQALTPLENEMQSGPPQLQSSSIKGTPAAATFCRRRSVYMGTPDRILFAWAETTWQAGVGYASQ